MKEEDEKVLNSVSLTLTFPPSSKMKNYYFLSFSGLLQPLAFNNFSWCRRLISFNRAGGIGPSLGLFGINSPVDCSAALTIALVQHCCSEVGIEGKGAKIKKQCLSKFSKLKMLQNHGSQSGSLVC